MKITWADVEVGAKKMPLFTAQAIDKPTGAVIVLQEVFGVNSHIQEVTKRAAELGYLAVAPDLFYRQGPRFTCGYDEFEKALPHMKAINNEDFLTDLDQVFSYLVKNYSIASSDAAVMGFCMGGRLTYLTATQRDIAAGISFYGGGIPAGPIKGTDDISCPMLLFFGGLDQHISQTDVETVRMALHENNKEAEVITYENADHGFFCNERKSFEPKSAQDAWKRTTNFLKECFDSAP